MSRVSRRRARDISWRRAMTARAARGQMSIGLRPVRSESQPPRSGNRIEAAPRAIGTALSEQLLDRYSPTKPRELAKTVFKDPFAIERLDDRENYGEERFVIIGVAEGKVLLFVAYTEREERIRIISARRATQHEQDHYFQQNA